MMFCKNCGSQLEDGTLFCPRCGTRIGASLAPEGHAAPYGGGPIPPPGPPKKKRRFPFIIAGVGAAVLLIGGICAVNAASLSHFFRKSFSSPKSYFQYVELHALETESESFCSSYNDFMQGLDTESCELSLRLEDAGRSLLGTVIPEDLAWFQELSLKIFEHSGSSDQSNEWEFSLNDSRLATLMASIDWDLHELYLKIPELSDNYLGAVIPGEDSDDTSYDQFFGPQKMQDSFREYAPDGDTLEDLINRYGRLIIENISDVTKSDDSLIVGSVSEKCTLLEARVSEEELYKIGDLVLSQLLEDEDVENIIRAYARTAQNLPDGEEILNEDTMYRNFSDKVRELRNTLQLESEKLSGGYLLINLWVNSKGKIAGSSLSISSNGTSLELYKNFMPEDGKDYAFTTSLYASDTSIMISGKGKQTSSRRDGDFSVTVGATPVFTMKMEGYDRKKAEKGYLNGRFTFRPQEGIMQGIDEMGGILSNFSLQVDCEQSRDISHTDVSLLSADSPLFTLSINVEAADSKKTVFPDSSDTVYNMESEQDVAAYVADADWNTLLSGLEKAGLPSTYVAQVKTYIDELKTRAAYAAYD